MRISNAGNIEHVCYKEKMAQGLLMLLEQEGEGSQATSMQLRKACPPYDVAYMISTVIVGLTGTAGSHEETRLPDRYFKFC